ncbi:uncharacterized protein LOC142521889 [Primulina tabacum]|uniref:uncharacterized protein LOC142521889 n=1 Tax=Primulina tabacum TaxID=48773 RepID=UPI003F59BD6E
MPVAASMELEKSRLYRCLLDEFFAEIVRIGWEEEILPPPPNQDVSARVLAGMARLLEQHVGNAARVQPKVVYEWFRRMELEDFSGTTDPFVAEGWIMYLEVMVRDMEYTDRVRCTIYLLKGDTSIWWEGVERGVNLATLTWEGLKRVFYDKYFTADVCSRLKREFMSLRYGDSSVAEFVQKFDRDFNFMPLIENDAAEKLRHLLDCFRPTIRWDVMLVDLIDYTAAFVKAFRAEQSLKDIEWEMQRKRNRAQQSSQHNKKLFIRPSKGQGQQKPGATRQPQKPGAPKKQGHIALNCPKLEAPKNGRAYVIHAEEAEPDTAIIIGRIYLKGLAMNLLLDFGATHSFIYESFVSHLKASPKQLRLGFKVMVPSGEAAQSSLVPHIISCLRARRLRIKRCQAFLATIVSIPYTASRTIEEVEIVKEVPDVFSDNVTGVPPTREVEFSIELMSGTVPISKARYCLAPTKMKELKDQIQELLNKGFIRHSSSPWGGLVLFECSNERTILELLISDSHS